MKTNYFTHNGIGVAAIGKSGSSAIARAILFAIQPDYTVRSASDNQDNVDRSLNRPKWQAMVPKCEEPDQAIIPVRDPVERFRSACAQDGVTAAEQLVKIESKKFNFHTRFVSDYLREGCRLYRFPEHIDGIAAELALTEIPSVNDSESNNGPKPNLTEDELARVRAIYAADIALYESIMEGGQVYVGPPTTPEPALPAYVPQLITAWQAKATLALTPHPQAGTMLVAAETTINAMPDGPEKVVLLQAWSNSANFSRTSPTILSFATALGMDSDALDNLFRMGGAMEI